MKSVYSIQIQIIQVFLLIFDMNITKCYVNEGEEIEEREELSQESNNSNNSYKNSQSTPKSNSQTTTKSLSLNSTPLGLYVDSPHRLTRSLLKQYGLSNISELNSKNINKRSIDTITN